MSGSTAESRRPDLTLLSSRSPEVYVRHPDTRAAYALTLSELLFRIEHSLDVSIVRAWVPLVVAMGDGLYIHRKGALWRARAGRGFAEPARSVGRLGTSAGHFDELVGEGVIEGHTVEEIYHQGDWDTLERPRTWELNGWWEQLYGVIPMPPAQVEGEDEGDEDELGVEVGVRAHPFGLQSADNQVRQLLERGLLSQSESLYRLKVSIHEQTRAQQVLMEGWRITEEGALALPVRAPARSVASLADFARRLARMHRRQRQFSPRSLEQLVKLGLAKAEGGYFSC